MGKAANTSIVESHFRNYFILAPTLSLLQCFTSGIVLFVPPAVAITSIGAATALNVYAVLEDKNRELYALMKEIIYFTFAADITLSNKRKTWIGVLRFVWSGKAKRQ